MQIKGFAGKIDMLKDINGNIIEQYIDGIDHHTKIRIVSRRTQKNEHNTDSFRQKCEQLTLPGQLRPGIPAALAEAIANSEGITIYGIKATDGHDYLIFPMQLPWEMKSRDRTMSGNMICSIFSKHISRIIGVSIDIECETITITG